MTGAHVSNAMVAKVSAVVAACAYVCCVLVLFAGWFVAVNAVEDRCLLAGDNSNVDGGRIQGVPSWSWIPLGETCTYELRVIDRDGVPLHDTHVDAPSPFVSTTVILLVAAPVLTWSAWKLGRGRRPGTGAG